MLLYILCSFVGLICSMGLFLILSFGSGKELQDAFSYVFFLYLFAIAFIYWRSKKGDGYIFAILLALPPIIVFFYMFWM